MVLTQPWGQIDRSVDVRSFRFVSTYICFLTWRGEISVPMCVCVRARALLLDWLKKNTALICTVVYWRAIVCLLKERKRPYFSGGSTKRCLWTSWSLSCIGSAFVCLYGYPLPPPPRRLTNRLLSEHLVVSWKWDLRWNTHLSAGLGGGGGVRIGSISATK
jgi:hypothetical protein